MRYEYYYCDVVTQNKPNDRWYLRIDTDDNSVYLLEKNEWLRIMSRASSVRESYIPITYEDLILDLI